ncbi:MAG: T9SS type A sorting domain-containing protein [Candidatus Cloacimonetes bacterium]|nr:T9SS type A sorting domain-containing protein [Candidatus Cloacimonadota bacterium]
MFLISETNIQLKYGFWNPITEQREHPLCRADNDPIEIYATLAATSKHSDEMRDGSFTFEYQHPHPSIPDMELTIPGEGDMLVRNMDLHRNHYPQSSIYPWPSWLDYPWYNPLWPEAHPYLERGTVRIWGSVFQARKGFMRRPYLIPEWDGNGIWNMGNDYYGGTSAPESTTIQLVPGEEVILQNQNYPGTTGSMVGYKVILMPDNRFVLSNRFGDDYTYMGGIWNVGMGLSFLDFYDGMAYNGYFLYPSIMPYLKVSESKCMDRQGDVALYGMDEVLMRYSGDDYYWSDLTPSISSIGKIQAVVVDDWYNSWVYQLHDIGGQRNMQIRMMNSNTAVVDCAINWNVGSCANDIAKMQDGRIVAAKMNDAGVIEIWELSNDPYMIDTWNLSLGTGHPIVTDEHCRIYLIPNGFTAFEVVLFQPLDNPDYPPHTWGALYYAHADVSVGIDDPVVPSIPAISFSAYPNPFGAEVKLEIKGAEQHQACIEVYNLRGQKVAAYNLQKGMQHFTWKGLDSSDRRVGSGIYFIRLLVDGKLAGTRRVCRIE